jgi:hypothetical protein
MRRGKIIAMRDMQATVLEEGTKRTWKIPCVAMQGYTDAERRGEQAPYEPPPEPVTVATKAREFQRGDTVTFDDRDGRVLAIDPHYRERLRSVLLEAYNKMQSEGKFPLFVCGSEIRSSIAEIISREISTRSFAVVAYEEVPRDAKFIEMTKVILEPSEVNA